MRFPTDADKSASVKLYRDVEIQSEVSFPLIFSTESQVWRYKPWTRFPSSASCRVYLATILARATKVSNSSSLSSWHLRRLLTQNVLEFASRNETKTLNCCSRAPVFTCLLDVDCTDQRWNWISRPEVVFTKTRFNYAGLPLCSHCLSSFKNSCLECYSTRGVFDNKMLRLNALWQISSRLEQRFELYLFVTDCWCTISKALSQTLT